MNDTKSPAPVARLHAIAMAALDGARVLSECGCRVRVVHEAADSIVRGLGAHSHGLRSGYASLGITVDDGGEHAVTQMITVSGYGVNHQLDQAVRQLISRTERGELTPEAFEAELACLEATTPKNPPWFVAIATGLACAAFGRLFGVDWPAFFPVFLAGAVGQRWRAHLHARGMNGFLVVAFVSFLSALLGGLGARIAGSQTVNLAIMASVLLLVPGVPATNSQVDIVDGFPTMGSARAVTVLMVMLFTTTGIWIAQALLGVR